MPVAEELQCTVLGSGESKEIEKAIRRVKDIEFEGPPKWET